MELLRSTLLAVPHGFPTRAGGVSQGPFASLNASATVGDDAAAVAENLRRLEAAAQVPPGGLLTLSQVHGDRVVRAVRGPGGGGQVAEPSPADRALPAGPIAEADAVWTDEAGVAVGVRTADCLPMLLVDPVGRRVAAVHAGWRGVLAEILARALEQLVARGTRAADVRLAVGPAIQRCCFEVGGDLPERFAARFGGDVVVGGRPRPHLDLALAARRTAARCGVLPEHVDVLPQCTSCDARFFSHRRDQGRTGRHLAFVTCAFNTRM